MSVPEFVQFERGAARVWRAGDGVPITVLGGLAMAAQSRADRLAQVLPGREFVAVEVPGFGESEWDGDSSPQGLASFVMAARDAIGHAAAPLVAFEGAASIATAAVATGGVPSQFVGLFDVSVLDDWRGQPIPVGEGAPRSDGLHLVELWSFMRDRALLTGIQVAREGGPLATVDELEAASLGAMRDPQFFWRTWRTCMDAEVDAALSRGQGEQAAAAWLATVQSPATPAPLPAVREAHRRYIRTPRGLFHCRIEGEGRTVIALPSAPGSSEPLMPLIKRTAQHRRIMAVDYLGNGDSSKPDASIDIRWIAESILELADALGVREFDLWGTHTGANIALEMSILAPGRVGRMVLEAPILMEPDEIDEVLMYYFHDITPTDFGDHVMRAWNLRRDMFMFWPWFKRSRESARSIGVPDTQTLHEWAFGLLKSGRTYSYTYRAAFQYPTAERLQLLAHSALICAGPADMLAGALEIAPRIAPTARVQATPATTWYPGQGHESVEQTLDIYDEFWEETE